MLTGTFSQHSLSAGKSLYSVFSLFSFRVVLELETSLPSRMGVAGCCFGPATATLPRFLPCCCSSIPEGMELLRQRQSL